jgi:hypothetical protein
MSFWYQMEPVQYALEIVEGNTYMLEELWQGRLHARQSSTGFEARKASMAATATSPTGPKTATGENMVC